MEKDRRNGGKGILQNKGNERARVFGQTIHLIVRIVGKQKGGKLLDDGARGGIRYEKTQRDEGEVEGWVVKVR